jgi:hypothetical protein
MKRLLLLAVLFSFSRPSVTDFMSPGLVRQLTPEAMTILRNTPIAFGGEHKGLAGPDGIQLQTADPNVANHEAMHILSYNTPGMVNGAFPGDGTGGASVELLALMAANYGDALPDAMLQFSSGMETYPMALQVVGWDPSRLPADMQLWYDQWFIPEAFH